MFELSDRQYQKEISQLQAFNVLSQLFKISPE